MSQRLSTLIVLALACLLPWNATAQPTPVNSGSEAARLLEQNRLVADVARNDPDGLWALVSRLEILMRSARDGGTSRSGAPATRAELTEIDANPALARAYRNDRPGTLALLRATNEALHRAKLRAAPEAPQRLALVIGSNGDSNWGRLSTADSDATLIAGALSRQGFTIFGGNALIDPDRRRLLQAIHDFTGSIGPNTVALVYYAGHGAQLNGRNFMVPVGAAIPRSDGDYDRDLIAIDDVVLRRMQEANAHMNILVLDACRDHPPLPSRASASLGLAPMSAPAHMTGTLIMYSTEPNDVARDSEGQASDSPFASAFAAAISTPGLELRDVFGQVQVAVDRVTGHRQQPWVSYSAIPRFYFDPVTGASHEPLGVAAGEEQFHCPEPGSSITLADAGGVVKGTYGASDPTDTVLCRIVTTTGETQALLYNFYDPRFLLNQTPLRKAMADLLSNHVNQIEFQLTVQWGGAAGGPKTFLERWKRLNEETLPLGQHLVRTIKFERDREGVNFYSPRTAWYVWYCPAAGVFVRSEPILKIQSNFASGDLPGAFQATSFHP
ncbi:MAG TPA: caspase family protein [Acetobacteraceae bacterium]|nr:caspase family protein [Acetobacteraceae bacterium]